ncbi:rho GTPase-activating protein REN1-like [Arachis hypogaea]|uniref:rho GTPase-activating protein REN1-like n=1 Tax=Arachis hypogaea TaxID=3818 RepID=UPI003B21BDD9
MSSTKFEQAVPQQEDAKRNENTCENESSKPPNVGGKLSRVRTTKNEHNAPIPPHMTKSATLTNVAAPQRPTMLGRTSAKKNLSMESIQFIEEDDEVGIERLETIKTELQNQIADEAKENSKLLSDMQKRKEALPEHHLALEREVVILQEQLRKEKSCRTTLEAGLKIPPRPLSKSDIDEKIMSDLEELLLVEEDLAKIKRKLDELRVRLSLLGQDYSSVQDSSNQPQHIIDLDMLDEISKNVHL